MGMLNDYGSGCRCTGTWLTFMSEPIEPFGSIGLSVKGPYIHSKHWHVVEE